MKALFQLYIASMKEFSRDRMALFWTMAFPIIFIVLFGIIFSGGGNTSYNVGLAVEDKGQLGQQLGKAFESVPVLKVTEGTRDDLLAKFKNGDLNAVIAVPAGVSSSLTSSRPAAIDLYYDPSKQADAQIVSTIVDKVVSGFDQQVQKRPVLLSVTTQTLTAQSLTSIDFLLPGILGLSLMQLGLFGTAPALVQLREQQVLRRIGVTPLPRITLLASQVLNRLTIGLVQTVLVLLVGMLLFNVQMVGNWGLLALVVLLGAVMFVAMGYFIASLAKTQDSVTGIAQLINFPMMFLSGLFFPLSVMPEWIKPLVSILPLTYLADALRQIMVGSPPAFALGLDVAVLVGWGLLCSVLAVRFFKWE